MDIELSTDFYDLLLNYSTICISSYFMSAYVFCKSQYIKLKIPQLIYLLFSGIAFTGVFVCVRMNNYYFSYFLSYIIIPVLLGLIGMERVHFLTATVIGLVSLSLVTVLTVAANIISGTVLWIIKAEPHPNFDYFIVEIVAFLLCITFMNIKRFRRGLQFFQEENNYGIGLSLSAIIMILKCINLRDNLGVIYLYAIFVIGIIICGFGLYLWIRRSITAHYRERLQLKSEEHYKEILEERDKEIEKLNQSNEYLAKIVHRDNHLMSNLNTSIELYFSSDDDAYKDDLLRELQTLAKERGELIAKEQLDLKLLPATGNHLIDGAINDLYIKAVAHGIDFNLTVSSTVDEIIGKYLSQTDLQTLLCDHIKDAIIAVDSRGEAGGQILVKLSMQNDDYSIDIYDNGVEFSIDTLSKLGLKRVTTHSDTGGSGIGFMTTFETLRKAYASLIITEYKNQTPFSKSVSFRFDGERAFAIRSYRSEKLKGAIQRNDVMIIG